MDDLVRWLGAQLDTDAREIADPYAEKAWHTRDCGIHPDVWGNEGGSCDCGLPARVLREIDAKRQALTDFETSLEQSKQFQQRAKSGDETDAQKQQRHDENIRLLVLLKVVKQLASAYSDRDGYAEAIVSLG